MNMNTIGKQKRRRIIIIVVILFLFTMCMVAVNSGDKEEKTVPKQVSNQQVTPQQSSPQASAFYDVLILKDTDINNAVPLSMLPDNKKAKQFVDFIVNSGSLYAQYLFTLHITAENDIVAGFLIPHKVSKVKMLEDFKLLLIGLYISTPVNNVSCQYMFDVGKGDKSKLVVAMQIIWLKSKFTFAQISRMTPEEIPANALDYNDDPIIKGW